MNNISGEAKQYYTHAISGGNMKIISVCTTKGGVGKSSIATNLAAAGAAKGQRVLLIDCDIQKSSMCWRNMRQNDDIVATAITTPTVHKDIGKFEGFDLAIIDCGGETVSPVLPSAMNAAAKNGLLIIPVLPSVYDVWATEDTLQILRQVRSVQDIDTRFLINQEMPKRLMSQEVVEALDEYKDEVPTLTSRLVFREAYKKSIKDGKGVIEYTDPKAKAEMTALFDEIMGILNAKEGE